MIAQDERLSLRDGLGGNDVMEVSPLQGLRVEGSPSFEGFLVLLKRYRFVVLGFWAVMFVLGSTIGTRFASLGKNDMEPPRGSKAYEAEVAFKKRFPTPANQVPLIVLVECLRHISSCDVRVEELRNFTWELQEAVLTYNDTKQNLVSIESWYSLNGTFLDDLKGGFVSSHGKNTFINMMVRTDQSTPARHEFIDFVSHEISKLRKLNTNLTEMFAIGATGIDAISATNHNGEAKQIAKVDIVTAPIATAVLAYMVGSGRLLMLAISSMVTSILLGMLAMTTIIVGFGTPEPEMQAVQLSSVIALALSIDYNLFLLGRFKKEIENGSSPSYAIYIMMFRAGHVVLMSGLTVFFVLLAFVLVPAVKIRMDGITTAVFVLACILVNLTLTPAMLYAFPSFFSEINKACRNPLCRSASGEPSQDSMSSENSAVEYSSLATGEEAAFDNVSRSLATEKKSTLRLRVTKKIVQWPYNLLSIIALYVLVLPLAWQILRINLDHDILHILPRDSEATAILERMYSEFPGGTFAPYYVLINTAESETIYNSETFELTQEISRRIVKETECDDSSLTSPAIVRGRRISLWEARELLSMARSLICRISIFDWILSHECKIAREYEYLWSKTVNKEANSMLISIVVPFLPFDTKSKTFIAQVNSILDDEMARTQGGYELFLNGLEVGPNEIEAEVLAAYPLLVTVTILVVFSTLAFMLKSYFIPVRLAFTLFLPLAAVFGLAVLVYQDGVLDWTGIDSISGHGGFFWTIPILIVTLISGLCLDYDVLLISAIMEHRSMGYDVQAATVKACVDSGATINAAGLIMFCAFGGLLIAQEDTINQSGWLLSTSILVDTFLVNTILVPALVSMGDKFAWYPTKMPQTNLITLEDEEFLS